MIDPWYVDNLVCPVDQVPLEVEEGTLVSQEGRHYPIVDGIPVMLVEDEDQTIGAASESIRYAREYEGEGGGYCIETLGIGAEEKEELRKLCTDELEEEVDPVVSYLIAATNGIAYESAIGALDSYPIPDLRLTDSNGESFLDVGCSWGRWSIAAAEKGYEVIGIDPSLGAVKAARRVSRKRDLSSRYVVADSRYLPFRASTFDTVFSYSVLQHLSREDAQKSLEEVGRVLKTGGGSLIQMANAWGIRSLYHQIRRGFRSARGFEVRYWTIPRLKRTFQSAVGKSQIEVDCFFGLGLQASDVDLMSPMARAATYASEILHGISSRVPPLRYFADSVYVRSRRTVK